MKSTASFTFIELIIIVAVVILFFGFSLGYYTKYGEQKKLEGDSRNFVEMLELAKKKIASGDKPNSDCLLSSVTVMYDSSTSEYSMSAQCPTDVSLVPAQKLSGSAINFLSSGSVVFKPFGAQTIYSSACILLKNASTNTCRQITLEASGVVTETKNDTCTCQ